ATRHPPMLIQLHSACRIVGKTFAIVGGLQLGLLAASAAIAQPSTRTPSDRAVERDMERAEHLPARRPFLASRLSGTFNSLDRSSVSSSSQVDRDSPHFYSYGDPGFLAAPVYAATAEGSSRRVGGPTTTPASIRNQAAQRASDKASERAAERKSDRNAERNAELAAERALSAAIPRPDVADENEEPRLGSRRTRHARGSLGGVATDEREGAGDRERPARELTGILDEPVDGNDEPLTPPTQNPRPIGPRAASRNLPRSTGR
ncbi:MAG: hypothetical protein ACKPEY_19900, partial [Planctomycetota bacterium]